MSLRKAPSSVKSAGVDSGLSFGRFLSGLVSGLTGGRRKQDQKVLLLCFHLSWSAKTLQETGRKSAGKLSES